jgi:hypothetical protein
MDADGPMSIIRKLTHPLPSNYAWSRDEQSSAMGQDMKAAYLIVHDD